MTEKATYEEQVREEVQSFVEALQEEFRGTFDYIEGIDKETSVGLQHLEAFGDENDSAFNKNPLEVTMGVPGIDMMTMEEFEKFDDYVKHFADDHDVKVEATDGNGDYVEYTFYLHSEVLGAPR